MAIAQTLYDCLPVSLTVRTMLLGLIIFLILAWMVHGYLNRVPNLPPGPRSWPFVGCLPQLIYMNIKYKNSLHEIYKSLYQQYGPVCYLPLPLSGKGLIIVSGYQAVNDTMNIPGLGEDKPGLTQTSPDELAKGLGIIFASGETWREHRRFSLTILRGFGVGKRSFEDQISTESMHLMKEIESGRSESFEPTLLFCNAVSNIICSVAFGKRFEYDDPEFKYLLHSLQGSGAQNNSAVSFMFFFMPNIIPYILRIPFLAKGPMTFFFNLRRMAQKIVNEHKDTFDNEDMRDFIDVYLKECQNKHEQGIQTHLSDVELRAVVHDFFLAGTKTTSTTLRWAILYMLKFPEVQIRVQEELDSEVGRDRLPRLSDKPNLPYTQAVINEIQRMGSILFLLTLRYANNKTQIGGFAIPKDSYVTCNLYSTTRHGSVWEEPDVFNPERFLDDDRQFMKPPQQIVFGAGKRACLGEQLARMELFIFYTHLMHRFSFKKPEGVENVDIQPDVGMVMSPRPYNICAIMR